MKRTLFSVLGFGVALAGCTTSESGDDKESATEQAVTQQSTTIPFQLTSQVFGLGGFQIGGSPSSDAGSAPVSLAITAQGKWTSTANTNLTWDADKVRQGQTLNISRTVGPVTGKLSVLWS